MKPLPLPPTWSAVAVRLDVSARDRHHRRFSVRRSPQRLAVTAFGRLVRLSWGTVSRRSTTSTVESSGPDAGAVTINISPIDPPTIAALLAEQHSAVAARALRRERS